MNINELQPLTWNNERVLTTKELAEAYGCNDIKNIQMGFSRNKERFIEEKHYFLLTGENLQILKSLDPQNVGLKSIRSSTKVFTKRGAMLMAKIINTDESWNMYEQLIDFYFDVEEQQTKVEPKRKCNNSKVDKIQVLEAILDSFKQHNEEIKKLTERQEKFEDNVWLTPTHYKELSTCVHERIHSLYDNTKVRLAPKYREIWKSIHVLCNVTSNKQVRDKDYDMVVKHIKQWVSSKEDTYKS